MTEANNAFDNRLMDISTFLADKTIPVCASQSRVLVHSPCTLRNVVKQQDKPFVLLNKIPNLQVNPLDHDYCCGAAGTYMLEHTEMSQELISKTLEKDTHPVS